MWQNSPAPRSDYDGKSQLASCANRGQRGQAPYCSVAAPPVVLYRLDRRSERDRPVPRQGRGRDRRRRAAGYFGGPETRGRRHADLDRSRVGDAAHRRPEEDARHRTASGQPGLMGTANGTVVVYRVKLDTVRVGDILVNNVDAAVLEGNPMPFALLGMSFLNRMEMKREGQTMVLIRRF